jgi:hypothetical protein
MDISHQVSLALLPGVSAGYYQRALVDESGMIRTQEKHNRSVMVAVYGTPCAIPPRINSNSMYHWWHEKQFASIKACSTLEG